MKRKARMVMVRGRDDDAGSDNGVVKVTAADGYRNGPGRKRARQEVLLGYT